MDAVGKILIQLVEEQRYSDPEELYVVRNLRLPAGQPLSDEMIAESGVMYQSKQKPLF